MEFTKIEDVKLGTKVIACPCQNNFNSAVSAAVDFDSFVARDGLSTLLADPVIIQYLGDLLSARIESIIDSKNRAELSPDEDTPVDSENT